MTYDRRGRETLRRWIASTGLAFVVAMMLPAATATAAAAALQAAGAVADAITIVKELNDWATASTDLKEAQSGYEEAKQEHYNKLVDVKRSLETEVENQKNGLGDWVKLRSRASERAARIEALYQLIQTTNDLDSKLRKSGLSISEQSDFRKDLDGIRDLAHKSLVWWQQG